MKVKNFLKLVLLMTAMTLVVMMCSCGGSEKKDAPFVSKDGNGNIVINKNKMEEKADTLLKKIGNGFKKADDWVKNHPNGFTSGGGAGNSVDPNEDPSKVTWPTSSDTVTVSEAHPAHAGLMPGNDRGKSTILQILDKGHEVKITLASDPTTTLVFNKSGISETDKKNNVKRFKVLPWGDYLITAPSPTRVKWGISK